MTTKSLPEVQACFTELPDGTFRVSTDIGIHLVGRDFKDAMLQLVTHLNILKKEGRLPYDFNVANQIKIEMN
jgi:hypothetical protein